MAKDPKAPETEEKKAKKPRKQKREGITEKTLIVGFPDELVDQVQKAAGVGKTAAEKAIREALTMLLGDVLSGYDLAASPETKAVSFLDAEGPEHPTLKKVVSGAAFEVR